MVTLSAAERNFFGPWNTISQKSTKYDESIRAIFWDPGLWFISKSNSCIRSTQGVNLPDGFCKLKSHCNLYMTHDLKSPSIKHLNFSTDNKTANASFSVTLYFFWASDMFFEKKRNRYFMSFLKQHTSKMFILLQSMRKATSKSVIKFLENNVFSVFGSPERLVSDNGTQFNSHLFKSFLEEYSVKLRSFSFEWFMFIYIL